MRAKVCPGGAGGGQTGRLSQRSAGGGPVRPDPTRAEPARSVTSGVTGRQLCLSVFSAVTRTTAEHPSTEPTGPARLQLAGPAGPARLQLTEPAGPAGLLLALV